MVKNSFKKYFSYFSTPRTFAIDINNSDLKVFQVESSKGKDTITGWSKKKIPKGVVVDFEIKDKGRFIEILKDCLESASGKKIVGEEVVVSVPEDKVFLRVITIPMMSDEEAAEAIKWEVEANIPIAIDEVYFDWQIIKREKNELSVLIAATPQKVVDNLTASFSDAGLSVGILEANSVATGRCVLAGDEKETVLLVDIGIDGTSYFIYRDGSPIFSSSSSISGNMFTEVVSKGLGIEWNKAEHYKTKIGLGANKKERAEASRIYTPILSNLTQEIEKTIDFYEEKMAIGEDDKLEKVIMCGGGSNLKGLISYVALNIEKDVMQGNPWQNVRFKKQVPPISKEEAQSFITAIGLALRARDNEYFN